MKKLRLAIAALGIASTIWGAPLLNAKEAAKDAGKEEHGGWGEHGEGWMKKMGMSDADAAKFKAAKKAQMDMMKPLQEKQKLDIDSLRVLVDKKATDKDLTAAIATIKADHQAIEDMQKKHRDEMQTMLTPMQQAKIIIKMGEMGEHMMDGMHGGKGGDWKEKWGKGKGKDGDDHDEKEEHEHEGKGGY